MIGGFLPRDMYQRWAALDRYGNYVFLLLLLLHLAVPAFYDATFGTVLNLFAKLLPRG